jgi:hypothetical protein
MCFTSSAVQPTPSIPNNGDEVFQTGRKGSVGGTSEVKSLDSSIRKKRKQSFLRKLEPTIVALGHGMGKLVGKICNSFDPGVATVWDFETHHEMKLSDYESFANLFHGSAPSMTAQEK